MKRPTDELLPGTVETWGVAGTPSYGLYWYVRPQGVGFSAVLAINRVSILAILVINSDGFACTLVVNWVCFFFQKKLLFHHCRSIRP